MVYQSLRKLQMQWEMIARFLENTGGTVQARVMMYKSMTQSVVLYGIESWMVTGVMLKVLD